MDAKNNNKIERPLRIELSVKALIGSVSLLAALVVAVQQVSSIMIEPHVLKEARQTTLELIEEHARYTHPNSVPRREFDLVYKQLDDLKKFLGDRLDRLEDKVK